MKLETEDYEITKLTHLLQSTIQLEYLSGPTAARTARIVETASADTVQNARDCGAKFETLNVAFANRKRRPEIFIIRSVL